MYVHQQKNPVDAHTTYHLCIAADGRILPAYVIFENNLPNPSFTDGVPSEWRFDCSENGFMDRRLFEKWFDTIFLPHCGSQRPVVLVFDSVENHLTFFMLKKAIANDVHIIGIPAYSEHILQPLNESIFGPIKEKVVSMPASKEIEKAKFPVLLRYIYYKYCRWLHG